MSTKRIAVIGAGASGLPAIKSCLDEGLTPVCFEKSNYIGGLWHYTDEPVDGQACVMKSTVINTSKEMMCYSDFPMPEHYPVFMHNTQVYKYYKLYAEQFDLEQHIQFNTEVLMVTKAADFARTGKWLVEYKSSNTGAEKSEMFDGVLVCSGHHADKNVPTFPGLDQFKGQVVHTHDYRKPDGYDDKRVLVIGFGNSGGDVAVELSRRASQVYLSTRRGTWILNRVADNGYPLDMLFLRRPFLKMASIFPGVADKFQQRRINKKIDHKLYCLQPQHGVLQQHPFVNDDMPNRIICGSIKIKADVKCFTETGVEFVDGTSEDNIDVVLLATGYTFGFPFIDKEVIEVKNNKVHLYKMMYPPDLERNTLAFIGCFQPFGALTPIAEMQTRLATKVIKGDVVLPPSGAMWQDIKVKEAAMAKRYYTAPRHTIQVDYVSYMDDLADMVGCAVNFCALIVRDPVLALTVMFGPVTPYTYRLSGPGQWSGAREAIMTQWQRTERPLRTRPLPTRPGSGINFYLFNLGLVLILVFTLRFLWSFFVNY
ncbi:flavin-containing monooxygenase 5-like [Physella acuta]|uniref:flavin-containing monooxygenase 5-like n=1 Tax=Physella acuta TaxID=109671 RepID=UPI0027DE329D|nr:flavin-containing monooxygenase 5-like [Physella acuta]